MSDAHAQTRRIAKSFSMNEKPREVEVTPGFLMAFPWPLWDKLTLRLVSHQTLPAIEGWQDGFRFTILELKHDDYGFNSEGGDTAVTTFFIVAIPESQKGRVVGWKPADCEVSVDDAFVYLARPSKQARPREWRDLINKTIKVVDSLKTREETAGKPRRPTFRPKGSGVFITALEGIFFLGLTVLLIHHGVVTMVGWDYRTGCFAFSTAAQCLEINHAYSFVDAILKGGAVLLISVIVAFGAFGSLHRIKTLRRIKDDAEQHGTDHD